MYVPKEFRVKPGERGIQARGTDAAAGSSGYSFLASQLEIISEVFLVKPLQSVTHARDVYIATGGGFIENIASWATNYTSTGTNEYGLQGTNATQVNLVQVDIQKGEWQAWNWATAMTVSMLDMKRMEASEKLGIAPPLSLVDLLNTSVKTVWNKALDYVTYFGFNGQPGLINNTAVSATVLPNGASGSSTWASKTPNEILNDVNQLILTTLEASGYDGVEGMADTLLVPYSSYATITQPMTIAGCQSTKEYIEKYSVAAQMGRPFTINPLPNPWIAGQGTGGTNRALCYKNAKESVMLQIPQPITTLYTIPTDDRGGSFKTGFIGVIGQIMWYRPTTAVYGDGI